MCILGWSSDNGDPDNFLYALLSEGNSNNISFYKNKEVTALLKQAQIVTEREKRTVLYQKALKQIHKDVPLVPLAHNQQNAVAQADLEGFQLHPDNVRAMPYLRYTKGSATGSEGDSSKSMYLVLLAIAAFFYIFYLYSRPRPTT